MDEAAVVELFVAGVAAIVVLGAAAEGIGVVLTEGVGVLGIGTLAPGIECLVFGAVVGECAAVPEAGDEDIGGAEVVIELGGEADCFAFGGGDGAGVDEVAEAVAVNAFGLYGGGAAVGGGAVDFLLISPEVEGDFLFEGAAECGAGFELAGTVPGGIEEELAVNVGGGFEDVVREIVAEASRLLAYQYRFKAGRRDASATLESHHPRPLAFQRDGGVWLENVKERCQWGNWRKFHFPID